MSLIKGALMGIGDVLAQVIEKKYANLEFHMAEFDYIRLAKMASFGAFVSAPGFSFSGLR